MRILFSFTLQGQKMVDSCLQRIKQSKIPLDKCRFCYCDRETKDYLLSKKIAERFIIQSCGLNVDLDRPLNAMRLSKNKPDYVIISLKNTNITRYKEFETIINNYQNGLYNKLNLFTTNFMYPFKKHLENRIDSRIIICHGIHKELLDNYVDTCESLDSTKAEYIDDFGYTESEVFENMDMNEMININFKGNKNMTSFQQFFLAYLSDWSE